MKIKAVWICAKCSTPYGNFFNAINCCSQPPEMAFYCEGCGNISDVNASCEFCATVKAVVEEKEKEEKKKI